MARYASWLRPQYSPIFAFTDRWPAADALTICRGVHPRVTPFFHDQPEKTVDAALAQLVQEGILKRGDTAVILGNVTAGDHVVDAVSPRTI
jgi:pyruvate kinase